MRRWNHGALQSRASGKARFVGCCNYPAWLLAHSNAIAERHGWPALVCNQIPYNLIERGVEVEILPQALAEQIAITVYRPLLIGLLAGKYQPGAALPADSRAQTDPRIAAWLAKYGDSIRAFNTYAADCGLQRRLRAAAHPRDRLNVGASALVQLEPTLAAFEKRFRRFGLFDTKSREAGGKFRLRRRRTWPLLYLHPNLLCCCIAGTANYC